MKTIKSDGVEYYTPTVTLLNASGFGIAELSARTAYNSFDKSENDSIIDLHTLLSEGEDYDEEIELCISKVNKIDSSVLLDKLAWVHHHHSVLEQCELWFSVKGTSRGVLQEHPRHRHQELTVQSTRYTMSSVINAFIASLYIGDVRGKVWFSNKFKELKVTILQDSNIDANFAYDRLLSQKNILGTKDFEKISTSKDMRENGSLLLTKPNEVFNALEKSKQVRNVGDAFKHIVTDNWSVDLIFKMNLRSLKNYLTLRDSGAAFFQIRWLAQEIKKVTPAKYLDLIVRNKDK